MLGSSACTSGDNGATFPNTATTKATSTSSAFVPAPRPAAIAAVSAACSVRAVACAAANAVMDVIDREDLLANTRAMGERLADGLITLDSPHVVGQRGRGLLRALLLDAPVSAAVTGHALEQLLVVNNVASDAVRLAPPLNVTPDEIDEGLRRLGLALSAATHENGTS